MSKNKGIIGHGGAVGGIVGPIVPPPNKGILGHGGGGGIQGYKKPPSRRNRGITGHGAPIGGIVGVTRASHVKKAKRGWSPDAEVAFCSARAVAAALGLSVADALELYWATAATPDEGQTLTDALRAAQVLNDPQIAVELVWEADEVDGQQDTRQDALERLVAQQSHALILGLALPAPHAVYVAPDGHWWSWGIPYDPAFFTGAVIEEAWVIT